MLFFKCRISFNELVLMERQLPQEMYCISKEQHDQFHYGVIKTGVFNKLLNVLSGETLEELEYLSEDEFKEVLSIAKNKNLKFVGNHELLIE
jgi:hypothetical protein